MVDRDLVLVTAVAAFVILVFLSAPLNTPTPDSRMPTPPPLPSSDSYGAGVPDDAFVSPAPGGIPPQWRRIILGLVALVLGYFGYQVSPLSDPEPVRAPPAPVPCIEPARPTPAPPPAAPETPS